MAINSRLASATHIMCFLAYKGSGGSTSSAIARSLKSNPVAVLKILKSLEVAGLVQLRQGRHGGAELTRPPEEITLGQIHLAVETENHGLSLREQMNPRCVVARTMPDVLVPLFDAARLAMQESFDRTSLATLAGSIPRPSARATG